MNILIDNVNTENKGSELMLYAVLQELEGKHPRANVLFQLDAMSEEISYLKTTINCRKRKLPIVAKVFKKIKGDSILRRVFHIPFLYTTNKYPVKGLDMVLDAAGFYFSDQQEKSSAYMMPLKNYYKTLKKRGVKIIFLPQAFGPFKTKNGKEQAELLKKYADTIYAREEESYAHLINTGIDRNKALLYPDFTALVDGIFPAEFDHLKNGIAIIPNLRMIDKGEISRDVYIELLIQILNICRTSKKTIFFLNHEGKGDIALCEDVNRQLTEKIPIITDLNALEIKGVISQCFFVFSSRFHGCVSALSTGVPCLATGWSHKYQMLFKDYDMESCIFDSNNSEFFYQKVGKLLNVDYNKMIRNKLNIKADDIKKKNKEMWQQIWISYGC